MGAQHQGGDARDSAAHGGAPIGQGPQLASCPPPLHVVQGPRSVCATGGTEGEVHAKVPLLQGRPRALQFKHQLGGIGGGGIPPSPPGGAHSGQGGGGHRAVRIPRRGQEVKRHDGEAKVGGRGPLGGGHGVHIARLCGPRAREGEEGCGKVGAQLKGGPDHHQHGVRTRHRGQGLPTPRPGVVDKVGESARPRVCSPVPTPATPRGPRDAGGPMGAGVPTQRGPARVRA